MEKTHFKTIIIGGGSAGYASARTACETDPDCAVIDSSPELGGLCILRGCMPSKTLIYSAEVLHHIKHSASFGLPVFPEIEVDMQVIKKRKKRIIAEFSDYRQEQLENGKFTLFRNRAKFIGEKKIELDCGKVLTADKIFITTGSVINTPNIKGLAESEPMTSDHILDLGFLPKSIIVLGGGIVACELAQMLQRLGSKVTIVQRNEYLLKEFSPQTSTTLKQAFTDEGMLVYTGTNMKEVRKVKEGYTVEFKQDGVSVSIKADHLLNALGRKPNTESLNLSATGVEVSRSQQITINDAQQTSNPDIYAAGDCAGPYEVVHTAIIQAEEAVKHALGRKSKKVNYDNILLAVFTDPQIGTVGISENEIKKRGIEYISADYPFNDHGKSILMEAKYGFVKIFAEKKTGIIIGAECVSKDAGELIHAITIAVSMKATVFQALEAHWYHPTLSEIWSYPLEDIADEINEANE